MGQRGAGRRPTGVALFATCVADFASPGPARAAVEVLERLGVRVVFPAAQTCCGQPALNSGYPREAAALARRWVRLFEPYEAVVAASGSCVATVHHHYPRVLSGAWRDRARAVAERTWEFSQFVAAFGDELPLRLDTTVTYHDSCHMLRSLGEGSAPRTVLSRIRGLHLVEMADPDTCCGFGGTFSTKLGEVSGAMGSAKLGQAADTGADELVSADGGCLLHLQARADAIGGGARTRHIAEVVRDALQPREVSA